jgi:hypothetical protein
MLSTLTVLCSTPAPSCLFFHCAALHCCSIVPPALTVLHSKSVQTCRLHLICSIIPMILTGSGGKDCMFKVSAVNKCMLRCRSGFFLKQKKINELFIISGWAQKLRHWKTYLFHQSLSASASLLHPSRMAMVSFSWWAAFTLVSSLLSCCEPGCAGVSCQMWD